VCFGSHFTARVQRICQSLEIWRRCIAAARLCLPYCLAPLIYRPTPSSLLLFFLLFLPTLFFLDSSCVCRQPTTREPSANSCRRRCRHGVVIGLELRFLQLIPRHGHPQKASTSTCFSYHTTRQSRTHVCACGYTQSLYTGSTRA